MLGHRSVSLGYSAIQLREGRSLLKTVPDSARASSCGFPAMASRCVEVGEIRLFDKMRMNEGARPWFTWEDVGLHGVCAEARPWDGALSNLD